MEIDSNEVLNGSKLIGRLVHNLALNALNEKNNPLWSDIKSLSEVISNLEANDSQFDDYEIVQFLKGHIKHGQNSFNEKYQIVSNQDEILQPLEEETLSESLELACLKEIKNIEEEIKGGFSTGQTQISPQNLSPNLDSSEEMSTWRSWDSISLSGDSLSDDELEKITKQLSSIKKLHNPSYKNSEIRMNCLQGLLQFSSEEIVYSECWPKLRSGLKASLEDSKDQVVTMTLHVMVRLASSVMTAKGDLIINLSEHLTSQFRENSWDIEDLDSNFSKTQLTLRKCRLMNHLLHQLILDWFDFPGEVFDQITSSVFQFLQTLPKSTETVDHYQIRKVANKNSMVTMTEAKKLTPIHFMALFDPQAKWLKKWLFCPLNRDFISKLDGVLQSHIFKVITVSVDKSIILGNVAKKAHEAYGGFMMSFIGCLISSTEGRSHFPLTLEKNVREIKVEMVLDFIIKSLNSLVYESLSMEILLDILESSSSNIHLFENHQICNILTSIQDSKSAYSHKCLGKFLEILTTYEEGRKKFVQSIDAFYEMVQCQRGFSSFYTKAMCNCLNDSLTILEITIGERIQKLLEMIGEDLTNEFLDSLLRSPFGRLLMKRNFDLNEPLLNLSNRFINSEFDEHLLPLTEVLSTSWGNRIIFGKSESNEGSNLLSHLLNECVYSLRDNVDISAEVIGSLYPSDCFSTHRWPTYMQILSSFRLPSLLESPSWDILQKFIEEVVLLRAAQLNLDSHHVSLRILNVWMGNLDNFVQLQSSFQILDELGKIQQKFGHFIDSNFLMRNHLLVINSHICGPNERSDSSTFHQCLEGSLVAIVDPSFQMLLRPYNGLSDSAIVLELTKDVWADNQLRKTFLEEQIIPNLGRLDVENLIQQIIEFTSISKRSRSFPNKQELNKEGLLGLDYLLEYGEYCGMMKKSEEGKQDAINFLKLFGPVVNWPASVVFLVSKADPDKAHLLYNLISPTFEEGSLNQVGQNIQIILCKEYPCISSALIQAGFTPYYIVGKWIRQFFLKYLDWCTIQKILLLIIAGGDRYLVYISILILSFLEKDIMCHGRKLNLINFLFDPQTLLKNFNLGTLSNSLLELEDKYFNICTR